jgi:hypothetical protein
MLLIEGAEACPLRLGREVALVLAGVDLAREADALDEVAVRRERGLRWLVLVRVVLFGWGWCGRGRED